jgi:hypothetical protein
VPRDRALLAAGAELGAQIAVLLDPIANSGHLLKQVLGADLRSLATVRSRAGRTLAAGDMVVTCSYFGGAAGRWVERAPAEGEAARPCWGDGTGDLYLNDDVFLANVPERVFKLELGGYPVLRKWLGYRDAGRRPGVALSLAELDHLRAMVHRLAALLALHEALDRLYEDAAAAAWTVDELKVGG